MSVCSFCTQGRPRARPQPVACHGEEELLSVRTGKEANRSLSTSSERALVAWATPAALPRGCSSAPQGGFGALLGPHPGSGPAAATCRAKGPRGGEAAANALMVKAFAWLFQGAMPSSSAARPAPRASLLPGPQRGLGRLLLLFHPTLAAKQLLAWPSSPVAAVNHVLCGCKSLALASNRLNVVVGAHPCGAAAASPPP